MKKNDAAVRDDYERVMVETDEEIACLKKYIAKLSPHDQNIAESIAFLLIDRYETACMMQRGVDGVYAGARLAAVVIDKGMLVYSAALSAKQRKDKANAKKKGNK